MSNPSHNQHNMDKNRPIQGSELNNLHTTGYMNRPIPTVINHSANQLPLITNNGINNNSDLRTSQSILGTFTDIYGCQHPQPLKRSLPHENVPFKIPPYDTHEGQIEWNNNAPLNTYQNNFSRSLVNTINTVPDGTHGHTNDNSLQIQQNPHYGNQPQQNDPRNSQLVTIQGNSVDNNVLNFLLNNGGANVATTYNDDTLRFLSNPSFLTLFNQIINGEVGNSNAYNLTTSQNDNDSYSNQPTGVPTNTIGFSGFSQGEPRIFNQFNNINSYSTLQPSNLNRNRRNTDSNGINNASFQIQNNPNLLMSSLVDFNIYNSSQRTISMPNASINNSAQPPTLEPYVNYPINNDGLIANTTSFPNDINSNHYLQNIPANNQNHAVPIRNNNSNSETVNIIPPIPQSEPPNTVDDLFKNLNNEVTQSNMMEINNQTNGPSNFISAQSQSGLDKNNSNNLHNNTSVTERIGFAANSTRNQVENNENHPIPSTSIGTSEFAHYGHGRVHNNLNNNHNLSSPITAIGSASAGGQHMVSSTSLQSTRNGVTPNTQQNFSNISSKVLSINSNNLNINKTENHNNGFLWQQFQQNNEAQNSLLNPSHIYRNGATLHAPNDKTSANKNRTNNTTTKSTPLLNPNEISVARYENYPNLFPLIPKFSTNSQLHNGLSQPINLSAKVIHDNYFAGVELYEYLVRHYLLPNYHLEFVYFSNFKIYLMNKIQKIDCSHFFIHHLLFQIRDIKSWLPFMPYGNEIKVTKNGRSIFPRIEFFPKNLDPNTGYSFSLKFCPIKSKEQNGIQDGIIIGDGTNDCVEFKHTSGVQNGSYWGENGISFKDLKVTNNVDLAQNPNMVVLKSSVKYIIKLNVTVHCGGMNNDISASNTASYSGSVHVMRFHSRTAYTYPEIITLRVKLNKFASGERKNTTLKRSRKDHQKIDFYENCYDCHNNKVLLNTPVSKTLNENLILSSLYDNIQVIPSTNVYAFNYSEDNLLKNILSLEKTANYHRCSIFRKWQPAANSSYL